MEGPMIHAGASVSTARARALAMLQEVKLADPEAVMARYPHQLSGGQQQRIVIAMALIAGPALLVMDEPTTGLDVTVEAAVLDLVRELRRRRRTAILFISHNLGTVVRVCDRIGVMYRGELVEEGSIRQIFTDPRHPYTRGLLDCLPVLGRDKRYAPLVPIPGQLEPALSRPPGCGFAARCIHVDRARCTSAPIPLLPRDGAEIGRLGVDGRSRELRRKLQMVFQNPDSTLNPSHTVGYAISRALRRLRDRAPADPSAGVARLLEVVKLAPQMAARKPRQLSGGEKQRVAIARALAGDPDVIVADEPVSAVHVAVPATIVNLLAELQAARGTTLVFISHDLAVVRYLADHVAA